MRARLEARPHNNAPSRRHLVGLSFLLFQEAEWGEWAESRHKVAGRRPMAAG